MLQINPTETSHGSRSKQILSESDDVYLQNFYSSYIKVISDLHNLTILKRFLK